MLRRFRFGTLSLVATMLLVVSAAGWWKHHRDLHREEQSVLAALAKENCETLYSTVPRRPEDFHAWSDDESKNGFFDRIRELAIFGSPSPGLLRRTAMLPQLEALEVRWAPGTSDRGTPSPSYRANRLVNAAAPDFAAPDLVEADLQRPLPTGELMNQADQASALAAIRSSWETPATTPQRFVRSVQNFEFGIFSSRSRETFARDGESALSYFWWDSHDLMSDDGRSAGHWLQIDDGQFLHDLRDDSGRWRLSSRYGRTTRGYLENRYEAKDDLLDWSVELPSRTDSSELDYVERVERIDDVRVRLFFRPYPRSTERPGYTQRTQISDASVILREDLDWAPESIRETEDESFSAQAEERRYARVGGYVLPIEILRGPVPAEEGDWVIGINERTQFAWSIDPTFEAGTFSPNRFLAEPIASPQELPHWRWYYGTLGAGLALMLFLLGRRSVSLFGRRRRTTEEAGPTPGS